MRSRAGTRAISPIGGHRGKGFLHSQTGGAIFIQESAFDRACEKVLPDDKSLQGILSGDGVIGEVSSSIQTATGGHNVTRPEDPIIHDKQSDHNEHRMRRAKSWLAQSEKADSDEEKFICLWIAFNAAYGAEPPDRDEDDGGTKREIETKRFTKFLKDITKRDERKEREIRNILWKTYSTEPKKIIQAFLENCCVFGLFWQWARDDPKTKDWRTQFDSENDEVGNALEDGDVPKVFGAVFKRLYQLRNQVFHGGVTFKTGYGRSQLEDGARIMEKIVPVILKIMEAEIKKNPDTKIWGKVAYPRVGEGDLYG